MAGLTGGFGVTNSTEVQVVAARTGLLIKGRAVHPGFNGGRVGAVEDSLLKLDVVFSSEFRGGLLFGRVLMLVLIATVGIVGGGGAGLLGSLPFDWLLIGVIENPLNWPNRLLL